MVRPPEWITINGREVDLYTYKQLDKVGVRLLRERALRLKRIVEQKGDKQIQEIPSHAEGIVQWTLNVQASLTRLSVHDFGLPLVSPQSEAEQRRQRWLEFAGSRGLLPEDEGPVCELNSTAETAEAPRQFSDATVVPISMAAEWNPDIVQQVAKWETESFGGRTIEQRLKSLKPLAAGQEDRSPWKHLELFVAMDAHSGEAVASASLVEDDIGWKRTDHGLTPWLSSVYVKHSARRRGIGRRLVEAVARAAEQRGYSELFLYHCPDLRDDLGKINKKLTDMYQRWGFEVQKNLHKRVGCPQIVVMRRCTGAVAASAEAQDGACEQGQVFAADKSESVTSVCSDASTSASSSDQTAVAEEVGALPALPPKSQPAPGVDELVRASYAYLGTSRLSTAAGAVP